MGRIDEILSEELFEPFPERNTVFARVGWDSDASFYGRRMGDAAQHVLEAGLDGYEPVEDARHSAARSACSILGRGYGGLIEPGREQILELSPEEMTAEVTRTSGWFGADATGVAAADPRWFYAGGSVPDGLERVVVMTVAMSADRIRQSPRLVAETETGWTYTRMSLLATSVARFISELGFRAMPSGNDTALSIPLAMDAGLGRLGRNGLLITPEHGSCVRICKVFTDMPLICDQGPDTPYHPRCRECRLCAETCPTSAISAAPEPTLDTCSISNSRGIRRWAVNADRCYDFWVQNGADCSTCIAACPETPRPSRGPISRPEQTPTR